VIVLPELWLVDEEPHRGCDLSAGLGILPPTGFGALDGGQGLAVKPPSTVPMGSWAGLGRVSTIETSASPPRPATGLGLRRPMPRRAPALPMPPL
jgi:hypothetical protein